MALKATVESMKAFHPLSHASRGCVHQGHDNKGTPYGRIGLPKEKTAKPGEMQSIWLTPQASGCVQWPHCREVEVVGVRGLHPRFRAGGVKTLGTHGCQVTVGGRETKLSPRLAWQRERFGEPLLLPRPTELPLGRAQPHVTDRKSVV